MTIGRSTIRSDNGYNEIAERLPILIEEALHRGRTILHTSITADNNMFDRYYATIVWQENSSGE